MPKKTIKITKLTKSQRWRKKYKGVQYYLPFAKYPTREAAWVGWLAIKASLDTERQATKPRRAEYEKTVKTLQDLASIAREMGDDTAARLLQADGERLLQQFNTHDNPPPLSPHDRDTMKIVRQRVIDEAESDLSPQERGRLPTFILQDQMTKMETVYQDRLSRLQATVEEKTLASHITTFLERTEAKTQSGELSKVRWSSFHSHLKHFREWAAPSFATETITSKTLLDFHSHLMKEITEGKVARRYAHSIMVSVKHFIRWAWQLDLCGLPKNLDSKDLGFKVGQPKITIYTLEEAAIPAAVLPVEGLMQIDLDPVDTNRGVGQSEPPVAEKLVQPLLIVDGEVQARSVAEKLLTKVPFVVVLHEAAGPSPLVHGDTVYHRLHPAVVVALGGIGDSLQGLEGDGHILVRSC